MPQVASESFDAVIDKGTLDAILCGTTSFDHVPNTLLECARCGFSKHQQLIAPVSPSCFRYIRIASPLHTTRHASTGNDVAVSNVWLLVGKPAAVSW